MDEQQIRDHIQKTIVECHRSGKPVNESLALTGATTAAAALVFASATIIDELRFRKVNKVVEKILNNFVPNFSQRLKRIERMITLMRSTRDYNLITDNMNTLSRELEKLEKTIKSKKSRDFLRQPNYGLGITDADLDKMSDKYVAPKSMIPELKMDELLRELKPVIKKLRSNFNAVNGYLEQTLDAL